MSLKDGYKNMSYVTMLDFSLLDLKHKNKSDKNGSQVNVFWCNKRFSSSDRHSQLSLNTVTFQILQQRAIGYKHNDV